MWRQGVVEVAWGVGGVNCEGVERKVERGV